MIYDTIEITGKDARKILSGLPWPVRSGQILKPSGAAKVVAPTLSIACISAPAPDKL
jgi:hypothetical protein